MLTFPPFISPTELITALTVASKSKAFGKVKVTAEINKLGPCSMVLFPTHWIVKLLENVVVCNNSCHRSNGELSTVSCVLIS